MLLERAWIVCLMGRWHDIQIAVAIVVTAVMLLLLLLLLRSKGSGEHGPRVQQLIGVDVITSSLTDLLVLELIAS